MEGSSLVPEGYNKKRQGSFDLSTRQKLRPTLLDAAPPASAALAAAAAACIRAASPAAPERLRRDLDGYPRKRKAAGQPSSQ